MLTKPSNAIGHAFMLLGLGIVLFLMASGITYTVAKLKTNYFPEPNSVKCAHVLAIGQNAAHDQWFMIVEIDKQPVSIFSDDPVMAYYSHELDPDRSNFVTIRWEERFFLFSHKLFMTSMSLCNQTKAPDSQ